MLIWASLPIPFAVPWLRSGLNWYLFFCSTFFRGVVYFYLELKRLPISSGQSATGTMTMYAVVTFLPYRSIEGPSQTSPFPLSLSTFVMFFIITSLFFSLYGAFLVLCITVGLFGGVLHENRMPWLSSCSSSVYILSLVLQSLVETHKIHHFCLCFFQPGSPAACVCFQVASD